MASARRRRNAQALRPCAVNPRDEAAVLTRPRYLFVVSRQHPQLYELLIERFQDDRNVEVILDRRVAAQGGAEEHGAGDRRRRPLPANDLSLRSHLIITRED